MSGRGSALCFLLLLQAAALVTSKTCECQQGKTFTGTNGTIKSPYYDTDGYCNNFDCIYRIEVDQFRAIHLTIEGKLEDQFYDKIIFHQDSLEEGLVLTGDLSQTDPLKFCSSQVEFRLVTDSTETFKGFKVQYTEISRDEVENCEYPTTTVSSICDCFDILTQHEDNGIISTAGYPNNYCSGLYCSHVITVPEGNSLKVEIFDGYIGSDTVQIGPDFYPLTGELTGHEVYVDSNTAELIFSTDNLGTERGFILLYKAVEETVEPPPITEQPCACPAPESHEYGDDVTIITSKNYPDPYCPDTDCHYDLFVPEDGHVIQWYLEGETEENYDIVTINGVEYSGRINWTIACTSSNTGTLQFTSENTEQKKGFSFAYRGVDPSECCAHGGLYGGLDQKCLCPSPYYGEFCQYNSLDRCHGNEKKKKKKKK